MKTLTKTLLGAGAVGAVAAAAKVPAIRKKVFTGPVMRTMNKLGFLPTISDTEKTAIEAGTVWMEGELFSGTPDFQRMLDQPYPDLTEEERAFLDGPCEEVCAMVSEWEVQEHKDLPAEVWDYLREKKFFGMIVPKEHGGLGFSAAANSAVVHKLSTRSITLAITVMVPNSLGPAELLIHYGTEEQKNYYLPRLARGEEIPAFALTEAKAGSDAGGMQSNGVVFKGDDGQLYLRLNWSKRYITLAAISTTLGLAFKLRDPENHLGRGEHLGITCALVPSDTDGVVLGRRHDPMGTPFYNCPTEGYDVVVPIDAIIGGEEFAGQGWRMLMESLAAGRGISLPAQATAGVKFVSRVASGHASVRKQFGLPIGKFEGIEEPLARMGGFSYMMDAARKYTLGGLMQGAKPAVVAAIMKYQTTELSREIINDGMDVLGGNGISRGPRNLLAEAYIAMPISITVEGANILTRTLMIFGQGAIRCHPWALKEIEALENDDLDAFDKAFAGHVGHVFKNFFRSIGLSITRGGFASSPVDGPAAPYFKKLAWASSSFAILADLVMASMGGGLKRKEKITGRFADILIWMYFAFATLKRFEEEGRRKEDEPLMHWSVQYALAQIQKAFTELFENLELPGLTWLFQGPIASWSRINALSAMPSDELGAQVAQLLQQPGPQRERITDDVYVPTKLEEPFARLERAFRLSHEAYPILSRIKDAIKAGQLPKRDPERLVDQAVSKGIISEGEAGIVREAREEREEYVKVDSFTLEEYAEKAGIKPSTQRGDGARKQEPEVRPQNRPKKEKK